MEGAHNKTYRRQVPETDPEYQQLQEGWRQVLTAQIFGAHDVLHFEQCTETYELCTKLATEADQRLQQPELSELMRSILLEEKAKYEQQAVEAIEDRDVYLRNSFMQLAIQVRIHSLGEAGQDRKDFIDNELTHLLGDADIQQMVAEDLGLQKSDVITIEMLASKEVSAEVLYIVAARNVERLRAQQRELDLLAEEVKTEFSIKVTESVATDLVPEGAKSALLRIENLKVLLVDRLVDVNSLNFGSHSERGVVSISNEFLVDGDRSGLTRILFHEFLHELSGKSITISSEVGTDNIGRSAILHRKSGVALTGEQLGQYSPNRWLNEAITEWLALELSGYQGDLDSVSYKGSSAYPIERAELDRLFSLGLDKALVTKAYFENFIREDNNENQEKGKYFRELVAAINELESPFGFATIENKHMMYEIENALYDQRVFLAKDDMLGPALFEGGGKVFAITVTVGINPETKIVKKFYFACAPIQVMRSTITINEQWQRVEKALQKQISFYGGGNNRVLYSVELLEAPAV